MFRTDSGGGGNHPQSAHEGQPLPDPSQHRSKTATGSAAGLGQASRTGWRAELHRLEPLNLPLLPCGAGAEQKGPINHKTGRGLTGWTGARFTVPEILAMNGVVRSVGTRTGDGCLCFDIDGGTAIELALEHGCDPQQAHTWQVHRTTDPLRLKVLFSLTSVQQQQLGTVISKALTLEAPRDSEGKGEALELFHSPGKQVILLGEHPKSGGQYVWPDGHRPEALQPIPDCWWQLARKIAAGELGITPTPAARPSRKATSSTGWKPINPCPICRRNTTSWCTHRPDNGAINCRHGNTFSPVLAHGVLKPGQTITGTNGVTYAFTGDSLQADGHTFSSFVVHSPRQQQQEPRKAAPAGAPRQGGKQQRQDAPDQPPESFQQLIERLPDGWVITEYGPKKTPASVGEIAELFEEHTGDLLRFNEMTMYVEANTSHGWQAVKDADMDSAYVRLDQKGWKIKSESVIKAICHVARQRTIHPVREYLLRIEQDATITPYDPDRVAADLFRSKSALHGAMFRKWLIGAVARAMVPGCQMDYCLVLQSPEQGLYKSTALATLASQDWHTSTVPKDDKDFLLNVHSNWIYELAELESVTSKRAAGHMKNLITTRADNFRVPYGRTTETRKRSSVFCGSANTDSFLRDETGNRRYWVIPIEGKDKLNIRAIRAHRDAIWKAALIAHRAGELPMLSAEQEAASEQQNEGFKEQDAWLEMLQAWIGGTPLLRLGKDDPTPKPYIDGDAYSSADILYAAGLKRPDQINRADETRLGPLLRSLGFAKERVRMGVSRLQRWTNRTNLDQPQTAEVGPAEPVAPQSVSDSGPTGPTEKANVGRKQREQAGTIHRQAHGNSVGELLKQEVGPLPAPARNASAANGSEWTNPPHVEVGPEVGPKLNPPAWLPQLLALRAANPNAHASTLVNMLAGQHGITTTAARVRALLEQHDQREAAA